MDVRIKQAMIDGIVDGVRDAARQQFKELQFGQYRSEDRCKEVRAHLSGFAQASDVALKLIEADDG